MTDTPLFDELALRYRYDTLLGWSFEDGPCPDHRHDVEQWCDCPRPWGDAWDRLCGALGESPSLILPDLR